MKDIGQLLKQHVEVKPEDRHIVIHAPRAAGKATMARGLAPTKPRSERDELFDYFYLRLSGPWMAYAKKPLSKGYLATKISHLSVQDLYYLKSTCEDAERRDCPFSKAFWGKLKVPKP